MTQWHLEAERCVRDRDKRRWTPFLVTGSLIAYALTGIMAVAMMTGHGPVVVCGIGDMGVTGTAVVAEAVPVDALIEPDVEGSLGPATVDLPYPMDPAIDPSRVR